MLALSLLLSAVGVNAILGGEVAGVLVSDKEFFCANDCAYKGVFFERRGTWCTRNDTTAIVNSEGVAHPRYPHACAGSPCYVYEPTEPFDYICVADRNPGGKAKNVQWSEIEKKLASASSTNSASQEGEQGTTEKSKPASPEKSKQCNDLREKNFWECWNNFKDDFQKCVDDAQQVWEDCRRGN
ncbi:hypothetical protein MGU_09835 [Metarhizium guizhouense ARSEF 977]|uniref:Secreted protein n=1 Tax=Metarhizium guizhouense (strain ARSEF 977) TaxID=1276136 RepID=A0A0B4GJV3_METGA|nr:hypothetical protein MGU_09835 [Metarhizium guizhouense ARSEF 977]